MKKIIILILICLVTFCHCMYRPCKSYEKVENCEEGAVYCSGIDFVICGQCKVGFMKLKYFNRNDICVPLEGRTVCEKDCLDCLANYGMCELCENKKVFFAGLCVDPLEARCQEENCLSCPGTDLKNSCLNCKDGYALTHTSLTAPGKCVKNDYNCAKIDFFVKGACALYYGYVLDPTDKTGRNCVPFSKQTIKFFENKF